MLHACTTNAAHQWADPGESVDTGESEDNGKSEGTGDEPGKDESESSTHNCDYNEPSNAESDEAGGSSYETKEEADEAFRFHTDPLNLKGSWPSWHEWEMYQKKESHHLRNVSRSESDSALWMAHDTSS